MTPWWLEPVGALVSVLVGGGLVLGAVWLARWWKGRAATVTHDSTGEKPGKE